jgi:hypothetical protein
MEFNMAKHVIDGKGHASKGTRVSCKPTGSLSSLVDTKQLKHIVPNGSFVSDYAKAETKREALLHSKGAFQIHKTKGKDGKITVERRAIGTAHSFVFNGN